MTPAEIEAFLFELEDELGVTLDDASFEFLEDEIAATPSLDPGEVARAAYDAGDLTFIEGEGPEDSDAFDEDGTPLLEGEGWDDDDLLEQTTDRITQLENQLANGPVEDSGPFDGITPEALDQHEFTLNELQEEAGVELNGAHAVEVIRRLHQGLDPEIAFVVVAERQQTEEDAWETDFQEKALEHAQSLGRTTGFSRDELDKIRDAALDEGETDYDQLKYDADTVFAAGFERLYGTPVDPDTIAEQVQTYKYNQPELRDTYDKAREQAFKRLEKEYDAERGESGEFDPGEVFRRQAKWEQDNALQSPEQFEAELRKKGKGDFDPSDTAAMVDVRFEGAQLEAEDNRLAELVAVAENTPPEDLTPDQAAAIIDARVTGDIINDDDPPAPDSEELAAVREQVERNA